MEIVRYIDRVERAVRVGVRTAGIITPIAVHDLADLLSRPASELPDLVGTPSGAGRSVEEVMLLPQLMARPKYGPPVSLMSVPERPARRRSSVSQVYELVYEAARPELFFKSAAWRVVTDGEPVAIRHDSELNVPEAEMALVINAHGEIVGYTVCNDMSSRTIEGENPLYLPQAKLYAGSCALASGIRPAWEVSDAGNLGIELTVVRGEENAWHGRTSTSAMRRKPQELVDWLFAAESFPAGVILSTGTGLVPEMDFSLRLGDVVRIEIDQLGRLSNTVVTGKESFSWLGKSIDDLVETGATRWQ